MRLDSTALFRMTFIASTFPTTSVAMGCATPTTCATSNMWRRTLAKPGEICQKVVDGAFAKRTTFGQSSWLCGLFLGLLALLDSIREDDSLDYLVKELVTLEATPMFLRAHQ